MLSYLAVTVYFGLEEIDWSRITLSFLIFTGSYLAQQILLFIKEFILEKMYVNTCIDAFLVLQALIVVV